MNPNQLKDLTIAAMEDLKAQDIEVLPISDTSTIADYMIIATGTSSRHIQSIADNIVIKAKENKLANPRVEGKVPDEWILVDLGDVIAHVMLASAREFYCLEKLWAPIEHKKNDASK